MSYVMPNFHSYFIYRISKMGVCCCNSNRQAAFVMGIIFVVLNIVGVILGRGDAKNIGNSNFLLKIWEGCAWITGS